MSKETFDVVIVGGGYAGLAAALEARDKGASVLVLVDRGQLANNSAMSGGLFAMAGTPLQKEQGIVDSAENFTRDIMFASGGRADAEFVSMVTEASRDLYAWLTGLGATFPKIVPQAGHRVPRIHQEVGDRETPAGNGGRLIKLMHEAVRSRGGQIRLNTPVTSLIKDGSGRVTGVRAGDLEIEARQAVILAAGGFAKNPEMMRKYAPEAAGMRTNSAAGSTGAGISIGIEAGAVAVSMDTVLMSCTVDAPGPVSRELAAGLRLGLTEGIAVNKSGRRFMDETLSSYAAAAALMAQPDKIGFAVFDMETAAKAGLDKSDLASKVETAAELGAKMNIEGKTLEKTVADYNAHLPTTDAYGRPQQKRPLRGVLAAVPFSGMIIMTYGGLKADAGMRALDMSGRVIPGLFVAGDNGVGLCGPSSGHCAVPGYLTGCGNVGALVTGRLAGQNAMR